MITLGIESSCDETSVALVKDGKEILSNVIASQIDTHKKFGGVVPEIASRQHIEVISQVIKEAFEEAGLEFEDVDLVAATRGPGLIGALLVGLSAGKTFAYSLNKPFIGVNHIIGHVCANYITNKDLKPPFIGLIVSGGHTYLIHVKDYVDFELIGTTVDDAAGEAFDKVARVLGLGYPGGPIIDKLAREGKDIYDFPRVMLKEDNYNFSFSGLKTAVINFLHHCDQKNIGYKNEDLAASFQKAVTDVLVGKSFRLLKEKKLNKIIIAGGVAANQGLRDAMEERAKEENVKVFYPERILCTDNGAMIASAGYFLYKSGNYDKNTFADPNLGLTYKK